MDSINHKSMNMSLDLCEQLQHVTSISISFMYVLKAADLRFAAMATLFLRMSFYVPSRKRSLLRKQSPGNCVTFTSPSFREYPYKLNTVWGMCIYNLSARPQTDVFVISLIPAQDPKYKVCLICSHDNR